MQKITADYEGKTYHRVNSQVAKRLYEDNKEVILIPCNLYPFGGMFSGYWVKKERGETDSERTFKPIVEDFIYYNCNSETGTYPAYYTEVSNG